MLRLRDRNAWLVPAVLLVALLVASCAGLRGSKEPRRFTIVGTADIQGILEPADEPSGGDGAVGGIARIATVIDEVVRDSGDAVAVVSTGDDLMNRYFHAFGGVPIFDLMDDAGYELYAFGNHEFDKGPEVLRDALAAADFEIVCTDLKTEGTALDGLTVPTIVRDYGGVKVGFFSLMTEDFPLVTSGGDVVIESDNLSAAHAGVAAVRKQGAELVVALTHVGVERDIEIARSVPGIDIMFGGHSHAYLDEAIRIGGTTIVNGGEKGTHAVRVDVSVGDDGRVDPESVVYTLIPVTADVKADRGIERKLAEYRESLPEAVVIGRTDVSWNLTKEALRQRESSVANLVNDLMREKFGPEIVLNNAGAFRGKKVYPAGAVTDRMLQEIDEFSNYAYVMEIEGRYLLEVLERSAACYGEGGLLHASGLRYAVDLARQPQVLGGEPKSGLFVETPGERVTRAEVATADGGWTALDPARVYTVLSNSFIVRHGGDGYFWFAKHGKNLRNTYSTFASILAELATSEGVLNPGEPDGRLDVTRGGGSRIGD